MAGDEPDRSDPGTPRLDENLERRTLEPKGKAGRRGRRLGHGPPGGYCWLKRARQRSGDGVPQSAASERGGLHIGRGGISEERLVANGKRNRLCPAMNAELAEYVLDVLAHGSRIEDELLRYLRLVEPLDEKRENLEFPLRQLVRPPSIGERSR
jgi:hypothetical protein